MLSRKGSFLIFTTFLALLWLGANDCLAQDPIAEFQRVLRDKATFCEDDFMALDQGETVIKLLPAHDKREIAICGVVLIVSKQIYANHYFDSSLALTAFLNVPGPSPKSYLFYENRSRADGLEGTFGKIKRGIIEDKALGSLKSILHQTQLNLETRALNSDSSAAPVEIERDWRRWKVARVHVFVLLLWVSAFAMLLALRAYGWKGNISRGTHY